MQPNSLQAQKAIIFFLLSASSWVAWSYMVYMHQTMSMETMNNSWMPPQAHQAWSSSDFTKTFAMWVVMMIAMMMPSVIPMVLGFIRIRRWRNFNHHPYLGAMVFVLGYFLIWLVFCMVATALQWQLHTFALLSPMMESRNTTLSAGVLIIAGLYQLTLCKAFCLDHCRAILYLKHDCHNKSIIMGLHHGLYCVGSCWALMLMMFAVGVMNLLWMGLITLLVALEKTLPIKPIWLRCISGFFLLFWGGGLLIQLDLILKVVV
jgi:predicted metal-binding membrane protein